MKEMREFLSVKEVAGLLNVTYRTIYTLIQEKKLQHVRAGNRIRIPILSLKDYLKRSSEIDEEIINETFKRVWVEC